MVVDEELPTAQFHRYEAPTAVPQAEREPEGWTQTLRRLGLSDGSARRLEQAAHDFDVRGKFLQAREYARRNPGRVVGSVAALVIGAGLIARSRGR